VQWGVAASAEEVPPPHGWNAAGPVVKTAEVMQTEVGIHDVCPVFIGKLVRIAVKTEMATAIAATGMIWPLCQAH
jgi:hypothetical protein